LRTFELSRKTFLFLGSTGGAGAEGDSGAEKEERFHPGETAGWGGGFPARPGAHKTGVRRSRVAPVEMTDFFGDVSQRLRTWSLRESGLKA